MVEALLRSMVSRQEPALARGAYRLPERSGLAEVELPKDLGAVAKAATAGANQATVARLALRARSMG